MRKTLFTTIFILLLLAMASQGVFAESASPWAQPANPEKLGAASNPEMMHSPGHVLVRYRAEAVKNQRVHAKAELIFGYWYRAPVLSGETAVQAMNRWTANPNVDLVELDYINSLTPEPRVESVEAIRAAATNLTPNDVYYPDQWNFPPIQAPAAWDMTSGAGVTVAVVDSGISKGGEDLDCRTFVHDYNALTNTSGPGVAEDDDGHGTHVAGTIAQCTNNALGVAGLAFNANLMPVKVLDATGSGPWSDIAEGIDWAATHGADVINLSLGMDCGTDTWPDCSVSIVNDAIAAAASVDAVIVAASGNSDEAVVGFPANHPDVIGVGAVDANLDVTDYSNYGDAISLSAPGGDVYADEDNDGWPDGVLQETFVEGSPGVPIWNYWYFEGTSMAAPHVSGAAAMLRALYPAASRQTIQTALEQTALDRGAVGFDPLYGHGVVQIYDALRFLAPQSCTEEVANTSFETVPNPATDWTLGTQAARSDSLPHSGAWSIKLGRVAPTSSTTGLSPLGERSRMHQTITLPNTDSITLSFWYWPGSEETGNGDWQQVRLVDTTAGNEVTLMRVLEDDRIWKNAVFDLTGRAGHTVQLYFEVYNNYTNPNGRTWMYVDDVSVQACNAELAPCYPLTLSHTGQGADPVAVPAQSQSCPAGEYLAGELITLTAAPAADWHVASWTGTENNVSTALTNTVDMPAAAHAGQRHSTNRTVHALTLTHTGKVLTRPPAPQIAKLSDRGIPGR